FFLLLFLFSSSFTPSPHPLTCSAPPPAPVRPVSLESRVVADLVACPVINVTAVLLLCPEPHIYSPGLSSAVYLFTWFVMNFTSVRLVCHERHIVMYPFTWFAMIFTSPRIRSPGLS